MTREDAKIIMSGLVHDGSNPLNLTSKAQNEVFAAILRVIELTEPPEALTDITPKEFLAQFEKEHK